MSGKISIEEFGVGSTDTVACAGAKMSLGVVSLLSVISNSCGSSTPEIRSFDVG